ncbi:MAG TPA: RluA family pseudouridine synthase [Lachnospiraceae bacterium]|nr:RluA family pseudouridine synthase [Lachnospiraceae bacterium]
MNIPILYEDNHIIVCEKPAGVLAQSDRSMDYDMVNYLKNHVHECERNRTKLSEDKTSNAGVKKDSTVNQNKDSIEPYIALIHRLDRPVGGVMVFGKTQQAAKFLSEQVQAGSISNAKQPKMVKKYFAVIDGDMSKELGRGETTLVDYLAKDSKTNQARISSQNDRNAKKAELSYRVLEVARDDQDNPISLIEVSLKTGRHHQIRAQMANHKAPLWGDTKYNKVFASRMEQARKEWTNLGLYSCQLTFIHPVSRKELTFQAMPKTEIFSRFSYIKRDETPK